MKIIFEPGEKGFHEAYELKKMVHFYANAHHEGERSPTLEGVEMTADERLDRPEFEQLLEAAEARELEQKAQTEGRLRSWWHDLMGPSTGEQEMAAQRLEALDRAQRAESACFEALADAEEIRRECEQLHTRIRKLENPQEDS